MKITCVRTNRIMIIRLERALIRGDINIEGFKTENIKLGQSAEDIKISLAKVRRILKEYFNIDMDKERV